MGPLDAQVPIPHASLPLGQKDGAAVQLVVNFLTVINVGQITGMQATGALTDSFSSNPATLTIQDGNAFRLDIDTSAGQRSTRIHGRVGATREIDGKKHSLAFVNASSGLFVTPMLLSSVIAATAVSVLDQGSLTLGGANLHRISVAFAANAASSVTTVDKVSVIDLYFDPSSHLLQKSAIFTQLDPLDRERYLQVTTYGNYKAVSGVFLPFSLSATLNGQQQWSLAISELNLNPTVPTAFFSF